MTDASILQPVVALAVWTMVMWFWMYATRIPAMNAKPLPPEELATLNLGKLDAMLPPKVQWKADNYNHLHEQPTVFYALALYSHMAGMADPTNVALAWSYVGLRIVHSLIQCTVNFVPVRFLVFTLSTLVLIAMTVRNVLALFPPQVVLPQ